MQRTVLLAAGVVFLASGCAGNSPMLTQQYGSDIDHNKVAAVNKAASDRGVEVHWVNYPERKQPVITSGT